jgi:hypothetical protein
MILDSIMAVFVNILSGITSVLPEMPRVAMLPLPQPIGDFANGFSTAFFGMLAVVFLWRIISMFLPGGS